MSGCRIRASGYERWSIGLFCFVLSLEEITRTVERQVPPLPPNANVHLLERIG
jgi:hypothetical protein